MTELYICVDTEKNSNKFWKITKLSDGIETSWGRITGTDPNSLVTQQTKKFPGDPEKLFNKKIKEKTREGRGTGTYTKLNLAESTVATSISKSVVEFECEETRILVDYLTRVNIHNITQNSSITYSNGQFTTPFGLVSKQTVQNARSELNTLYKAIKSKKNYDSKNLNTYLRLIPRDVGRNFSNFLTDFLTIDSLKNENDLLDSLEISLTSASPADIVPVENKTKLTINSNELDWATKRFKATAKDVHVSKQWKPTKLWDIKRNEKVNDSIGNMQLYWHGTKASNLLSILYNGLIIPPASSSYCNGRLYGNGIYFSDCSTKSLNYACGYWDNKYDQTCYMLLCEVFMGKTFNVKNDYSSLPKAGYDSTSAIPGSAGIQNTEFIVYNVNQVRLKHLMEFKN